MEIPASWKHYPVLMTLIEDHHFVAALTKRIRQALKNNIDLQTISAYALFYYQKDLLRLFKRKQEILDSVLEAGDHCRISAAMQLENIFTLIAEVQIHAGKLSSIEQLVSCLESYNHFEERIIFARMATRDIRRLISLNSSSIRKEHSGFENWNDRFMSPDLTLK